MKGKRYYFYMIHGARVTCSMCNRADWLIAIDDGIYCANCGLWYCREEPEQEPE